MDGFFFPNGEASGPSGAGRALGKSQVFGAELWHPQNQGVNASRNGKFDG